MLIGWLSFWPAGPAGSPVTRLKVTTSPLEALVMLEKAALLMGWEKVATYFHVIYYGLFRYMLHGVPEIAAYFVIGLAGGIISVAAIKHDFRSKKYQKIVTDSADLIMIAVGLIFIAAFLEVYITPIFF